MAVESILATLYDLLELHFWPNLLGLGRAWLYGDFSFDVFPLARDFECMMEASESLDSKVLAL